MEDDFEVDETAESVDVEIVKAILAGKRKELDAMEAFGIFDVCEELPKDAKLVTTRWEKVPQGDKWRNRFVAREFRHDEPEMEGFHTSGSTAATGRLVDMHAVQHGYSILCFDAENANLHAEEDEEVHCWPPKEWVKRCHARGARVEYPWWQLKKQFSSERRKAAKFNKIVVSATVGLGLEPCTERPSIFRRPGTTLIFELHQDDFYVSGRNVELALLQENLGAKLRLKPAEPTGPRSHCSNLRRTRTRVDVDPIHVALRETHIKNVLDILGLGDHKCKSMPTPIVQTRQKSDEDEQRLGEEDRRAYHRCVGIFRYLLKYRPENAFCSP